MAPAAVPLTTKWTILHPPSRRQGTFPLPKSAKLCPLPDLQFTGPDPSHAFILGNFAADGEWGVVNGAVERVTGRNAALRLARAKDFELEGVMHHEGYGGWFLLLGWSDDRGYSVSNFSTKQSGSPWFITEYRGRKAIADAHQELDKFEWRHDQPFRVTMKENTFSLEVGKVTVLDKQPLANYQEGDVILGVYDTRYGPKPLKLRSLRARALQ